MRTHSVRSKATVTTLQSGGAFKTSSVCVWSPHELWFHLWNENANHILCVRECEQARQNIQFSSDIANMEKEPRKQSPNCGTPLMQDVKKRFILLNATLIFFFFLLEIMANKITYSSIWENLTWWCSIDISRTGPFILPKHFNTKILPNFPLHQTQPTGRADKWYLTQFQKWSLSCTDDNVFLHPPRGKIWDNSERRLGFLVEIPIDPSVWLQMFVTMFKPERKNGFRSRLPFLSHSCVLL